MGNWIRKTASAVLALALLHGSAAYGATVVIDPGHGGSDPGAIGVNGLYEKTPNRAISLKLREELVRRGYEVALTSETDQTLSLQERVMIKERLQADVFVSIHANWYHSPDVSGTLVLYYDNRYPQAQYPASPEMAALTPKNRELAQLVVDEVSRVAGTVNRGIVPSAVYVVRNGTMPSILVETAFLSNPADAERLKNEDFQRKVAIGIANGIERFMPVAFPDIAGHWARDAIIRLYEFGIVQGFDSRYAPERALTRAEFLAMADRVFHFTEWGREETPPSDTTESAQEDTPETKDPAQDEAPPADSTEPAQDETPRTETPDELANGGTEMSEGQEAPGGADNGQADSASPTVPNESGGESADSAPSPAPDGEESGHANSASPPVRDESGGESGDDAQQPRPPADEPVQEPFFADLPESHWGYSIVQKAAQLGIIQGYADGTVRPDRPVTRAEMAVLFDRLWRLDTNGAEIDAPFTDVDPESWYADAVYRLVWAGLLKGVGGGRFLPDDPMTRAQAAVMLDRFLFTSGEKAQSGGGE